MRIALDLRYVSDAFPGIGRYAYHLARGLVALESRHEFVAVYRPQARNTRHDLAAFLRMPGVTPLAAPDALNLAGQAALPSLLRRNRVDLYHTPYYLFPYAGLPCPAVVTVHDVIPRLFPAESSARARLLFDLLVRLALRAACGVVTVSRRSRDDIARFYGVPAERMAVIYEAADESFHPADSATLAVVRARYGLPEVYALCVASNKPHKNLTLLARAWGIAASDAHVPPLILAGQRDRQAALMLPSGVRDLGAVAEADLPALYGGAHFFVYPSRYEGFGLPPLEALACGAPVICSAAGSLPEVVDGAALLVDANDAGALARAVRRLAGDAALRAELRAAGLRRAATFSWRRAARETLAFYERMV